MARYRRGLSPGGPADPKSEIWLLFDKDNGHYPSKNYVWWFPSLKAAREFRKHHYEMRRAGAGYVELSRPIRYALPVKIKRKTKS